MKKLLISTFVTLFLFQIVSASKLSIIPAEASLGQDCVVPFELSIEPNGDKVLGTDIILESSMEFVDFVPNKELFEYYLPPKLLPNGNVVLGAFTSPGNDIVRDGVMGTVYFKETGRTVDGYIKFKFDGQGVTSDTNLSRGGGIDTLELVGDGYYKFDGESCVESTEVEIEGGFHDADYGEAMDNLVKDVEKEAKTQATINFLTSVTFISGVVGLLIIILLIILWKKRRGKEEKRK